MIWFVSTSIVVNCSLWCYSSLINTCTTATKKYSSTLLAFCGSPVVSNILSEKKAALDLILAVTGKSRYRLNFVSESYGGPKKQQKKAKQTGPKQTGAKETGAKETGAKETGAKETEDPKPRSSGARKTYRASLFDASIADPLSTMRRQTVMHNIAEMQIASSDVESDYDEA